MYQPKTGQKCTCKKGVQRDNCPTCEGTGQVIDFKAIRNRSKDHKTMFALTHISRDGIRTLTGSNQGRNHFDTEAQAREYLASFNANNNLDTLRQVFGPQAIGTFDVRPIECYHHGDAVGVYFDK